MLLAKSSSKIETFPMLFMLGVDLARMHVSHQFFLALRVAIVPFGFTSHLQ